MSTNPQKAGGFSLVELALATGVATFCLVSILGLIPIGLKSNQDSVEKTAAASITRALVAGLRAPARSGPSQISSIFGFAFPSVGASGTAPQTIYLRDDGSLSEGKTVGDPPVLSESRYRASVSFVAPAVGQKTATMVRVLVTWPAVADPNPLAWPTHYSGSYETVTMLDRN